MAARALMHWLLKASGLALGLGLLAGTVRADELIGTNGERFVGKVVAETKDSVVFESELGGRFTLPRSLIRELHQTTPAQPPRPSPITSRPSALTNSPSASPPPSGKAVSTNLLWQPPFIGSDKADWIQLKSGEWLRGQLRYVQQSEVEFDSDELDQLTLKLKNVRQIYPAKPMWAKFDGREPLFGTIVVSNDVVSVFGQEQVSLPREQFRGLTPSGIKGINDWSGKLSVGLSLQSGNNRLTTLTTIGELARRTPNTRLQLDYFGNFSQVNDVQNANNQRVNLGYDIRLDRHWFLRPVALEYFHDPVANIGLRGTAGVAAGYYIFDRPGLEWNVSAGPSYQYTRFETVEPGQADSVTTLAGILTSKFTIDITRRLDLSVSYRGSFISPEAGRYTHHTVSTLSFEIKRHLSLDVSFIWDYINNPQQESSGAIPQRSDYYLTVGLGARF